MTNYKELMMRRDNFRLLRTEIRYALEANPELPGARVLKTAIDPDTGDLLVTAVYGLGDNATERTHRITIKDETADVPRETSSFRVETLYRVNGGALRTSDRTVEAENWTHAVEQVREFLTSALPRDTVTFCKANGGAVADGGPVVDVPRETSSEG